MKKIVIILLLMLNAFTIYSQRYHSSQTNALVVFGSGGYSLFENTLLETTAFGGSGGEIGIGYELGTTGSSFLFQTNLSASYLSSSMILTSDVAETKRMYDTERNEHTAYYDFHNISETDSYLQLNYTLLFGYKWRNGMYFLTGPKIAYALTGEGQTSCEVRRTARYDGLIGEDGNGFLSNMPNHYLNNVERTYRQKLNPNPYVGLSAEVGYSIFKNLTVNNSRIRTDYNSLRIALFCDLGGYININNSTNTLIVNQATDGSYQPTIANFLYREQSFLPTLFCGVKFTYVLEWIAPVCVICE